MFYVYACARQILLIPEQFLIHVQGLNKKGLAPNHESCNSFLPQNKGSAQHKLLLQAMNKLQKMLT